MGVQARFCHPPYIYATGDVHIMHFCVRVDLLSKISSGSYGCDMTREKLSVSDVVFFPLFLNYKVMHVNERRC